MRVNGIGNPMDVSATPSEPLADAASRMRWNDVGCVAVLQDGTLVGILTERDLTRAMADGADARLTPVGDYMTPDPKVANSTTTPREAARRMVHAGVRHLPLVEAGVLVGILSMREIVANLVGSEETAIG